MQETNKVDSTKDTVSIPTQKSWEIQFPEGPSVLPMKEGMRSSGDYWCKFNGLHTCGVDQVRDSKTHVLLHGLYKLSVVLPGYAVSVGEYLSKGTTFGPLVYVDMWRTAINTLCVPAVGTLRNEFATSVRSFYEGKDVVTARVVEAVQNFTGYKVHKQAIELFEEIMLAEDISTRHRYTSYEYSEHDGDDYQAAALLMKLHGFVVSRFAVPLGIGFRNGDPIIMLGQPQLHKDYPTVIKYRCVEMRVGKWLSSYYGSGVDFRKNIEDLKALNVDLSTYLCKTEQEWYDAYENGPISCMTGYKLDYSPVRVYATTSQGLPDNGLRLFIQYTGELFGDDFKVQARAIVNIKTNEYVRAYGDAADAILRANGYERNMDCLAGKMLARIPHPEHDGAVLMPYLDSNQCGVDEEGEDSFIITDSYDHEAQDADGYIYIDEVRCTCAECGERHNEEDMVEAANGDCVCFHCIGNNYVRVVWSDVVHPTYACSWSDYHECWVYDRDVADCAIEGTVHYEVPMSYAQGYDVLTSHVEMHPVHGLILTEHAASILGEPYLGNDADAEAEEAQEAA